jgi:hypothetical protein
LSPTIFGRELRLREKVVGRGLILLLFNTMTVVGVLLAADRDAGAGARLVGLLVATMFAIMSIFSIRNSERRRLRAGKDWLSEGRDYVRLDQLRRIEVYRHSGMTDHVSFLDDEEHEVHFPVDTLGKNPRLRRIVLDAIDECERRGRQPFASPEDRAKLLDQSTPYRSVPDSDSEL